MTEQFYFTSYAHADQKFVDKLTAKLERSDIAIWKDVKAISPGEPWDIAIERAIQQCTSVIKRKFLSSLFLKANFACFSHLLINAKAASWKTYQLPQQLKCSNVPTLLCHITF